MAHILLMMKVQLLKRVRIMRGDQMFCVHGRVHSEAAPHAMGMGFHPAPAHVAKQIRFKDVWR